MPKVALIGPELFPIPPIRGGATEQFIDQLARRLTHWRPVVIGVGDPELPDHEFRGEVEYLRVSLSGWRKWLYKRYRDTFPYYDRRVAAVLREVKPALVHVHNRPLLALYLKKEFPHLPFILHMHNLYTVLGKRERPAPGTPIPVEAFAACSRFVLEKERDRLGVGAASHVVVYNGVDPEAFQPQWQREAQAAELRERYGLDHEPTVLYVGKLRESKGIGVLLSAMELVWQKLPQAVLVLVGGTEFGRGRIHRQTPFLMQLQGQLNRAAGRVITTGFIPPSEVSQTYLLGDIFVAPSQIDEGLPLVVLEASASGLPIITTQMGGIPEFVQDGLNGLLLGQKDDLTELAEKISLLLQTASLRKKLGEQGRHRVLQLFSWEKIAQRQEQVYDEIMEK